MLCPLMVGKDGNPHRETPQSHGPRREKTCLRVFANNTGADQPAHPRGLISTFVVRFTLGVSYLDLLRAKFHFSS